LDKSGNKTVNGMYLSALEGNHTEKHIGSLASAHFVVDKYKSCHYFTEAAFHIQMELRAKLQLEKEQKKGKSAAAPAPPSTEDLVKLALNRQKGKVKNSASDQNKADNAKRDKEEAMARLREAQEKQRQRRANNGFDGESSISSLYSCNYDRSSDQSLSVPSEKSHSRHSSSSSIMLDGSNRLSLSRQAKLTRQGSNSSDHSHNNKNHQSDPFLMMTEGSERLSLSRRSRIMTRSSSARSLVDSVDRTSNHSNNPRRAARRRSRRQLLSDKDDADDDDDDDDVDNQATKTTTTTKIKRISSAPSISPNLVLTHRRQHSIRDSLGNRQALLDILARGGPPLVEMEAQAPQQRQGRQEQLERTSSGRNLSGRSSGLRSRSPRQRLERSLSGRSLSGRSGLRGAGSLSPSRTLKKKTAVALPKEGSKEQTEETSTEEPVAKETWSPAVMSLMTPRRRQSAQNNLLDESLLDGIGKEEEEDSFFPEVAHTLNVRRVQSQPGFSNMSFTPRGPPPRSCLPGMDKYLQNGVNQNDNNRKMFSYVDDDVQVNAATMEQPNQSPPLRRASTEGNIKSRRRSGTSLLDTTRPTTRSSMIRQIQPLSLENGDNDQASGQATTTTVRRSSSGKLTQTPRRSSKRDLLSSKESHSASKDNLKNLRRRSRQSLTELARDAGEGSKAKRSSRSRRVKDVNNSAPNLAMLRASSNGSSDGDGNSSSHTRRERKKRLGAGLLDTTESSGSRTSNTAKTTTAKTKEEKKKRLEELRAQFNQKIAGLVSDVPGVSP